jgi:D-alanine-D-alanine ligase
MGKLRIGIFFGGSSREREVSFAGGRTVYDNLDKSLFEAIPIFIDSFGNPVQLNWQCIYKGSIRDFYPPARFVPELPHGFQIYAESLNPDQVLQNSMLSDIGKPLECKELTNIIDFAFLALHGSLGEDGTIQGMLEWLGIPYSGSGVFASALGMNKARQKDLQERAGLYVNQYQTLKRKAWTESDETYRQQLFRFYNREFHEHFVVKPANQGSSLGVSVLQQCDYKTFVTAIDLGFFRLNIEAHEWLEKSEQAKVDWIRKLVDIKAGMGLPVMFNGRKIFMPDALIQELDKAFEQGDEYALLEAPDGETEIVIEEFIHGREFSCIVIRDDEGNPIALPPTEIKKSTAFFDYRSKYLPGLSHKITPMPGHPDLIDEIRTACTALYDYFGFNVYARIDGFVGANAEIFLNDPNTTSGMMPSSFFFHQAAEIGLNPSQFLTFIIRNSLAERIENNPRALPFVPLLHNLDEQIDVLKTSISSRRKIAVIMGGYSYERHISMESGRNIYEKLSSSAEFEPIPVFLTGNSDNIELYLLPLNIMLKDNADDIREKVTHFSPNSIIEQITDESSQITARYNTAGFIREPRKINFAELSQMAEGAFIALHGRPGEDGTVQELLKKHGMYYNGSSQSSASVTINKYLTNQILRNAGFLVADHALLSKTQWLENSSEVETKLIEQFGLPLIAKPVDDGCSAAVRKVKTAEELHHFIKAIFRAENPVAEELRNALGLQPNEEFPLKSELLIEKFVQKEDADRFLEITGGMLTKTSPDGRISYEVFEPSEALAEGEILSLEEKFLAGQGQNLTPSRFSRNADEQNRISNEVRKTLQAVAKILNVTGYCRIDAFVKIFSTGKIETWIIEVNSLPGMTPATCIYHQAAINGYKPFEFIREILKFGEDFVPKDA